MSCGWKTTFAPGMEVGAQYLSFLDPMTDQPVTECRPSNTLFDPVAHPDQPVVCVDWCDAEAYCVWAGKRLCGHIGGGPPTADDFGDADAGQWYGACSNGGTTSFPYGNTYVTGSCNDGTAAADVGQSAACHGGAPPYDAIFDMSGNVQEWDDDCRENLFDPDGGARTGRICGLRGGNFQEYGPSPAGPNPAGSSYVCGQMLAGKLFGGSFGQRNLEDQHVGFRCCGD